MNDIQETSVLTPVPAAPVMPAFLGRRGALFGLVLRTTLLTVLTLGIYRFWAKTRLRRYFWGNVTIAGEPLEYTGRATELLVGFLIVVAVLVPLSVASSVLRVVAEGGPGWIGPVLDIGYVAVLLFLFDVAVYRMWRYRLTRTRWRGIRFGMANGALRYAGRAFLWRLGQVASLGFITPWMRLDLARYRIARMRLGDRAFALDGRARPLVLRWLVVWGIPLAIVVGFLAFKYGRYLGVARPDVAVTMMEWVIVSNRFLGVAAIAFAAGFILFIFYRIFEARYFIGCTTVGGVRLESNLRARSILPAFLLAWGVILLLLAVVFAIISGAAIGLAAQGSMRPEMAPLMGAVFGGVAVGLMLVLSPLVTYPIAVFQAVRHVWTSLSIDGIDALDDVVQAPKEEPRFGEGLADALDVGAI